MSSDLRRCCKISHVVIGRHILTCTSSTHRTDAEPLIRVAAPERSMASVDCQGSDHESDARYRAHRVAVNVAGGEQASATDLCGTPGRDVLLKPVVDALEVSYNLRVTDIPTNLARGQCPRFQRKTPPTSVDRGGPIAGVP